MKPLKISIRSVYGRDLYYPANRCAEAFALACGRKTLDARQLAYAVEMGLTVEVESNTGRFDAAQTLRDNINACVKAEILSAR